LGHTTPAIRDNIDARSSIRQRFLKVALITGIVAITLLAIASWQRGQADRFIHEHGPIEMLHLGLLAFATYFFFYAYRHGEGAVQVAGGALAMLGLAGFVREIDVKSLGGPEWFRFLAEHGLQEVLLVVMTLPIFVYLLIKRAYFMDLVRLGLSLRAWPLYASGACLLLAVYFDERLVTNDYLRFWEELIETYGYVFMVMASWRHVQYLADPAAAIETWPFKLAVGFAVLSGVLLAGVPFVEQRLLYHPDPARTSPESLNLDGVTERWIEHKNGPPILTWSAPSKPGMPVIVYFHGNGAALANRAERMRKYLARGYGMTMMTYRGYGGREGVPSERANVTDALRVYDELITSGVPASQIVVYGESLGTGVAIQVAAKHDVAGVVLDAPYTSMVEVAQIHYPFLPAGWLMRDRYLSTSYIGGIKAPLLVVHGEADALIPVSMGRKVRDGWGGPAEIATFAGAGHSDHGMFGSYDAIFAWLDRLRAGQIER
jgi:uncharacterized protein